MVPGPQLVGVPGQVVGPEIGPLEDGLVVVVDPGGLVLDRPLPGHGLHLLADLHPVLGVGPFHRVPHEHDQADVGHVLLDPLGGVGVPVVGGRGLPGDGPLVHEGWEVGSIEPLGQVVVDGVVVDLLHQRRREVGVLAQVPVQGGGPTLGGSDDEALGPPPGQVGGDADERLVLGRCGPLGSSVVDEGPHSQASGFITR